LSAINRQPSPARGTDGVQPAARLNAAFDTRCDLDTYRHGAPNNNGPSQPGILNGFAAPSALTAASMYSFSRSGSSSQTL
jgi:hypothetical protein